MPIGTKDKGLTGRRPSAPYLVLVPTLLVGAGVALLVLAAEGVVRAGSALGVRIGLSPLWIGLTVVALGTSAPELVVSVQAAYAGNGGIAVGNVVGSNILNILVVLGATAVVRPVMVSTRASRQDIPVVLAISIGIFVLALRGFYDVWAGIALIAVAIGYTWYLARRERVPIRASKRLTRFEQSPTWALAGLGLISIAALIFGGRLVLVGAVDLASAFGLSDRIIGLTVVALGTSLPELAISVAAALRGRVDLAVGNLVGSNLLNMTLILGSAALTGTLPVERGVLWLDMPVMLLATLLLWRFASTSARVNRTEAAVFLGVYGVYLYILLARPAWSWA